ncbi:MAG: CopD family protein, partial [Chloroflexota bacterium]
MFNLKKRTSRIVFVSISLLLLLIAPQIASAHGYIVRSIPQDRAVLQHAPPRLQYWFSENLEPKFSKLTVRDQVGNVIAEGGVDSTDKSLLAVRLPSNLPNGAYVAELRTAFASDGHVVVETRVFFVGVLISALSDGVTVQAVPLEVIWRVLVLSSALLLLGTFAVYAMVLVPAWGNSRYSAGLLPPRVMSRLNRIVGVALVVAFAGNILALLQQTMAFFDADIGRVIGEQLFNVVRIGTRFGDTWNARMLLLILVTALFALSIYLRGSQPRSVRAFWVANVWGMALIVGTFSVSSHAAGSLLLPAFGIVSDWLHGLGVGFWAGGVAALALIAPVALQPYSGDERRQALLAALRRFTRIAAAGLAVVIATGIYSALNWITRPADVATSYGTALILKIILVALLVGVGAAHHAALSPDRYQRWSAVIQRVGSFMPTLRLEALLVLLVLVAVGLLSATPIPQPDLAGQVIAPPRASQTVDGYTVRATITPGGPGINTYDVEIDREGTPVDGLSVNLRM